MKITTVLSRTLFILAVMVVGSCSDQLTDLNENPNGVPPSNGNPNQIMPTVQSDLGNQYMRLGFGNLSGVIQHTQEDGWFDAFNYYNWGGENWASWYGILRNNKFLYNRSTDLEYTFHQGVALTLRAFIFATITDLWGDAPYTEAVKGDEADEFLLPAYDSQEVIYKGVLEDLQAAAALFATGDNTGYVDGSDLYYNGDTQKWQQFVNSLILRYSMRLSGKLPDLARSGVEAVYSSGIYIKDAAEEATMELPGNTPG
ncbi:MAG TPA: SusD/RagB family nutrient-binding outer membrane lipoprotein, partial [Anseongella sp.]|nr:SusD/RagB family nutrient-binding outer membrane lipoprotein [Anseongella sp.]